MTRRERHEIIDELLTIEEDRLSGSKFYREDIKSFKVSLGKLSIASLERMLNNRRHLESKTFESIVKREVNKLDRAGMYNINYMREINALD